MSFARTVLLLVTLLSVAVVQAEDYLFKQRAIPRTIVLEETGDVLNLCGAALRKEYFQDDYIAAFYAHHDLKTPAQALADDGPRRMLFIYLRMQNQPRIAWEEAIKLNNSPDIVLREQIRISQFLKIFNQPLRTNDTVAIEYVPNIGTKIWIKGNVRGIIRGSEFFSLILKVWMGREPPSQKFRNDLFNLTQSIPLR